MINFIIQGQNKYFAELLTLNVKCSMNFFFPVKTRINPTRLKEKATDHLLLWLLFCHVVSTYYGLYCSEMLMHPHTSDVSDFCLKLKLPLSDCSFLNFSSHPKMILDWSFWTWTLNLAPHSQIWYNYSCVYLKLYRQEGNVTLSVSHKDHSCKMTLPVMGKWE